MNYNKWTTKEISQLKIDYPNLSNLELENKYNRTIKAITSKAFNLKIFRSNKWTKEEQNILIKEYPCTSVKELSKKLKKTIDAINQRASNYKIKKIIYDNGKKCILCHKSLKSNQRKFCSQRCVHKEYFLRHIPEQTESSRRRYYKNRLHNARKRKEYREKRLLSEPNFLNLAQQKRYKKNKEKYLCVSATKYYLGNCREICKICNYKRGEWHHEIYPPKKEDIIKAYNDGKIFALCRNCHERYHAFYMNGCKYNHHKFRIKPENYKV